MSFALPETMRSYIVRMLKAAQGKAGFARLRRAAAVRTPAPS